MRSWLLLTLTAVVVLAAAGFLAGLVRATWLLAAVDRRLRRLEPAAWPAALHAAVARTHVARVGCVDMAAPLALCAGVLRPRIIVSPSLVDRLGPDELAVVLLHEADHARRFEPLRRAARQALAEAFFYVPLVRWWAARQRGNAELRADRHAAERVGVRPVASALLALGSNLPVGAAGFDGAAELCVAQLLGQPLPRRLPNAWVWPVSAGGVGLAVTLAQCAAMGLLAR